MMDALTTGKNVSKMAITPNNHGRLKGIDRFALKPLPAGVALATPFCKNVVNSLARPFGGPTDLLDRSRRISQEKREHQSELALIKLVLPFVQFIFF